MSDLRDPAVLLAAVRASGARPVDDITVAQLDSMRVRAKNAGRELVRCAPPPGSPERGRARLTALGWSPHTTPSPEDSNAYPVRRLTATAQLTWACCLGLAWADATLHPHPGEPFTNAQLLDLAAEMDLPLPHVKGSLYHELMPALLVQEGRSALHLGPAVAALPPAFVEAMRRFHDRLPRPEGSATGERNAVDDESVELPEDVPPPNPEEEWEW